MRRQEQTPALITSGHYVEVQTLNSVLELFFLHKVLDTSRDEMTVKADRTTTVWRFIQSGFILSYSIHTPILCHNLIDLIIFKPRTKLSILNTFFRIRNKPETKGVPQGSVLGLRMSLRTLSWD